MNTQGRGHSSAQVIDITPYLERKKYLGMNDAIKIQAMRNVAQDISKIVSGGNPDVTDAQCIQQYDEIMGRIPDNPAGDAINERYRELLQKEVDYLRAGQEENSQNPTHTSLVGGIMNKIKKAL